MRYIDYTPNGKVHIVRELAWNRAWVMSLCGSATADVRNTSSVNPNGPMCKTCERRSKQLEDQCR